jgi:glyoxylase-like metal-dependent hydrolase (beta-lactamase superfamily II)
VSPITAIDLHWAGHSRSIACALLRFENCCALIDPGPASTVSTLRQRLEQQGVTIGDLSALLLTHIHLDHAAATGALVRENPRLQVYVHSRGVDHLIDPTKLLQSASRLYGDDMERLFGVFLPVPSGNIHVLEGGELLALGPRSLHVLYTPGHANHHVTYFDPAERVAFVGDTCGISIEGDSYILPATPPPDISVELWDASLDAIAGLHPKRLFLTHFSFSDNPAEHIANYRERLHRWRDLTGDLLAQNLEESAAMHRFAQEIAAEATQVLAPDLVVEYLFNGALNLSWLGLARYHRKRAEQLATQPAVS